MINFAVVGSLIVDFLLILIIIISIVLAERKGFSILVFNLICMVIMLVAVPVLCKPLTNLVYKNTNIDEFFSKHIKNTTEDFLEEQIEKTGHINTGKTNIARPIADKINNYIDEAEKKDVSNISKYVADKLSYVVISALVVIFICVVIRFSCVFIRVLLYFISELPIIRTLDSVGAIAYGIIRGLFIIYIVLAVLSLLSPLLANTGIIASINHSRFCEKFYNNNILLKIIVK